MQITLKAARVNAGLSQEELAGLLCVGKSSISRWESGRTPVPEEKLAEICRICGIERKNILVCKKGKSDGQR